MGIILSAPLYILGESKLSDIPLPPDVICVLATISS